MKQFGISDVEAAEYVGHMIDYYRGIAEKPEDPKPRKSMSKEKALARETLARLERESALMSDDDTNAEVLRVLQEDMEADQEQDVTV